MIRPLGKNQIEWLSRMHIYRFAICSNPLIQSLVARGLVSSRSSDEKSMFAITADGLRALADAIDCGRLELPMPKIEMSE